MNHMEKLIFTEEHELFRQSYRDFLKAEIEPNFEKWEKEGKVDRALFKKMGEMGFLGIHAPEDVGGSNLDYSYALIINEELGFAGFSGVAVALGAHQYLAMSYINKSDTQYIKDKYLKPSVEGTLVGSLGMTEPNAGSDLAAIKTTAVKEGDFYIVNGSKTFISNGYYGDYMVTAVKTDVNAGYGGISMLIIDLNAPGVTKNALHKMGIHSSDTGEIGLDNVKVPAANLVGGEGMGFYFMMQNLIIERMVLVWGAIAGSEQLIKSTIEYMKEREAFGKPISKFQALRHRLVDIATEVEACKAFSYMSTYRYIKGDNIIKECAMLKVQSTELLNKVAYECVQFHGGYGYIEEYQVCKAYRDARIQNIYGGTSEVMREIIAKVVVDGVSY